MKKNECRNISLGKGEVNVYDFGQIKLHAYKTNDFIDDEVFVVEKGGNAVIIESPCFYDNDSELESYVKSAGLTVAGMLISYHIAGGTCFKDARKYATKGAEEYGLSGGGAALIAGFAKSFGDIFDANKHIITDRLEAGETEIAGIKFDIVPTAEAYDIVLPEINAVYTHMLGHDCHSIVGGAGHADAMLAELKGYVDKGYDLVLTSHYTPEDLKDVEAKISYLEGLKKLAGSSADATEFKTKMKERYPDYGGEHYLDITSGIFFG